MYASFLKIGSYEINHLCQKPKLLFSRAQVAWEPKMNILTGLIAGLKLIKLAGARVVE